MLLFDFDLLSETVITPELKSSLVKVLGLLKDAAESFSKVHQLLCTLLCVGFPLLRVYNVNHEILG